MEHWNKGLPYWWKGTVAQHGGNEYWNKGLSTVGPNVTSANIPPPPLKKADSVLRTDVYSYDGVLNNDALSVMGVSNV